MFRSARAMSFGAAVSLIVHVAIAVLLPRAAQPGERSPELEIDVAYPVAHAEAGDASAVRVPGVAAPVAPGGADVGHNVDARDPGQGGDRTGSQSVILMLPRADDITLADAPLNALGVGQSQRIHTARDRASLEDRRATPHPMDTPFLASGSVGHPERRPIAATDARSGAHVAPIAGSEGAPIEGGEIALGDTASGAADRSGARSDEAAGAEQDSPGRGIVDGRGARASDSARVALGRPTIDEAHAATTTEERDARVRDDRDSELLAARMMQSVVESTSRRGEIEGAGRGGEAGAGALGTGGGRREGGRARALGPGTGAWDALDTSDPRYVRWFVQMRRRVEDALVFPHERELGMDQGTSVVTIVVRRDGSLERSPRVWRSSGFADLDGAALAAIESAMPFAPVPDGLAPGLRAISIRMPIEFSNPMVR